MSCINYNNAINILSNMSSAYPIIINQSNLVSGSTNTFQYNFSSNVDMSIIDIGLSSASLWFSWPNITTSKANNQFSIIHPTLAGTNTLNLTIPDGGYNISDLNYYLRYYLITQGYYIQNTASGDQTVYAEFRVNPSTYQVEYVSYPVPTALPSGYTAGPAISFPVISSGPQLLFTQAAFGTVIGFIPGTFPAVAPTTITATGSTLTPQVSDVLNVLLTLDSANNPFAPNSKIIHSISPAGAAYGSLITSTPPEISWVPQQAGTRQSITLQLTDQRLRPLYMVDTDVTIKLLIRYRDESKIIR